MECPDITPYESRAELHYHVWDQGQGLLGTKICLGVKIRQNAKKKKRIVYHDRVIRKSTRTLSFVIQRVRFKKNLQNRTLAFKAVVKLRKPSILVVNWASYCLFFLLSASTAGTYIFHWNSTLAFKGVVKLRKPSILVVNWVSSCLSFLLSAPTAATYIFTALSCTTNKIRLEPCALNAEFQHFILRFNKMYLLCGYHWKREYGVKGGPKTGWRWGYFTDNSNIPLFFPLFGTKLSKFDRKIEKYSPHLDSDFSLLAFFKVSFLILCIRVL